MRGVLTALLAATLAVTAALAQEAGGRGDEAPIVSPEVHDDGRVTLRFRDPSAARVMLSGELDGHAHPMTLGDDGVWTVTIGPLRPDIYAYAFDIDGVVALDPRNPRMRTGYGHVVPMSLVQVPGDGPRFYDVQDVPHGSVQILPYMSATLGLARTAWIYTPPGYAGGEDFPVLYLLHGAGDIESSWTLVGRVNNILDNSIAGGHTREMVVVMPLGHAIQSFQAGPPAAFAPPPDEAGEPGGLSPFARDLLDDLMPLVERRFKVATDADHRAIGGLSMGGGQAMHVAFSRPDLFRYLVLMSPAAADAGELYAEAFRTPAALNAQFRLFWMAVGENDAVAGPADRALHEMLTSAGVNHTFTLTPGRHEWAVWRQHLRTVAPLLFK